MMPTPYQIDEEIARVAERAGFTDVARRRKIKVDRRILPAFYWTKKPDFHLIEKHLNEGVIIPGASFSEVVEYTITKPEEPECQS